MKGTNNVDEFILSYPEWKDSLILLREIFQSTCMEETIKWGVPVYMSEGKNIAGMACFNSYTGIWFYQGALLSDKSKKLVSAQEGKTKALRQWRFSSIDEIMNNEDTIRQYIYESIENVRKGIEIKPVTNTPVNVPDELAEALKNDQQLTQKFDTLTLSKKRDFSEYIAAAKRMETKKARLEKIIPMIMKGEGLNDKYNK